MLLYVYAKNNPIIFVDPEGLACGTGSTDAYVPDEPFNFYFTEACEWHDGCYNMCGKSKSFCDKGFRDRMVARCWDQLLWKGGIAYGNCRVIALTYYGAVATLGKPAYCRAQKAEGCCASDPKCQ